jgi:hypothetical protein
MIQRPRIWQKDMTWLHTDPNWRDVCDHWGLGAEYMQRFQAGQHPEIWDINGGAASATAIWGSTILWIPEESIFLCLNCGLNPAWFYSPLTRDALLRDLAGHESPLAKWCSELRYYRSWTAACADCGTVLTSDDWTNALYLHDDTPDHPQCDACFRAKCEAFTAAGVGDEGGE